jgi:glycosyltransferase involved in cell wall biosynthesis
MNNIIPKISIVIITYNQEDLIGRALDSILIQKEWVYEIIICDDCSTDNNLEVISNYKDQFPELIKIHRNEQNLGIFGNLESAWSKPTGDMIFLLSGDDEFCNGLFEEANQLIKQNHINYKNELFCLYFDYKEIWPNGTSRVYRNDMIQKGFNPVSLAIRALISVRTTAFSAEILKLFYPVRKDIGIFADGLQNIQLQIFSTHSYYSSFIGSLYYAGIGVSKKTPIIERLHSNVSFYNELEKIYEWSKKDLKFLKYNRERTFFLIKPSLRQFGIMVICYFLAIDFKYGFKGLKISKFCFKIFKHSKDLFLR